MNPYAGSFTDVNGHLVSEGDQVEWSEYKGTVFRLIEALSDGTAYVEWPDYLVFETKWCNLTLLVQDHFVDVTEMVERGERSPPQKDNQRKPADGNRVNGRDQ